MDAFRLIIKQIPASGTALVTVAASYAATCAGLRSSIIQVLEHIPCFGGACFEPRGPHRFNNLL